MDIEKLKDEGVAGEFKQGASGNFLYFKADDHYTTCVSVPPRFQLGHGTLVFIPDEPASEEPTSEELREVISRSINPVLAATKFLC